MTQSRRIFLLSGLSGAAATTAIGAMRPKVSAAQSGQSGLAKKIVAEFNQLPGQKVLKIWVPTVNWTATINPDTALFCASSFKGFVLAEYLRKWKNCSHPRAKTRLQLN